MNLKDFEGKTGLFKRYWPFASYKVHVGCKSFENKIPKRIMSAMYWKGPLFTAGQTTQKMHCIVQGDGEKENVFASFRLVKFEFA